MKYLILGCGPAGIAAAKAIRGKDKKRDRRCDRGAWPPVPEAALTT